MADGAYYGNRQQSSWNHNSSQPGLAASACQYQPVSDASCQHQHQQQCTYHYPPGYPSYESSSQQYTYHESCPDPATQYGWQSYHAHGATTWEQATSLSGASWNGWTSFTGVRTPPDHDGELAAVYPPQHPQQDQSDSGASSHGANPWHRPGSLRCSADVGAPPAAPNPEVGGPQAAIPTRETGGPGPGGGGAASDGDDELYDPVAHADGLTAVQAAAAAAAGGTVAGGSSAATARPAEQPPASPPPQEAAAAGPIAVPAAAPVDAAHVATGRDRGAAAAPGLAMQPASAARGAAATERAVTPPPGATAADAAGGAAGAATPMAAPATAPAATSESVDLVVVWDLDETLIVFNSLLSGQFVQAVAAAHGRRGDGDAARAAGKISPSAAPLPAGAQARAASAGATDGGLGSMSSRAMALGQQLADMVFSFCDDHLAFQLLDTIDPRSFAELWAQAATGLPAPNPPGGTASAAAGYGLPGSTDPGVVHRATLERIAEVYGGGAQGLPGVLGEAACRTLATAMAEAESLTDGWVAAARRLLSGVTAAALEASSEASTPAGLAEAGSSSLPAGGVSFRRVRHVMVSAGHLVATLGKLLLWGLDAHFEIRDVYSASGCPKVEVFRALRGRYGPGSAYVAVGDGPEEERAAGHLGWGFVRVGMPGAAEAVVPEPAGGGADGDAGSLAGLGACTASAVAAVAAGDALAAGGTEAASGAGARGCPGAPLVRQAGSRQQPRPLGAIRPGDILEAAREACVRY